MSINLNYEDEECQRFNDLLDVEGSVDIAGIAFQRSRILYELASNTYYDAFNEFKEQEFQDLQQAVFDTYPACIAYNYRLSERGEGANDPVRKLLHLKDTWESIVYILFALVMGEVRFRNIELNASQIVVSHGTEGNPIYANFNTDKSYQMPSNKKSKTSKQSFSIVKVII